jgi:hypothetical protein
MRTLISALLLMSLSACTAMMVGGGTAGSYPSEDDCPEGQTRTENGCKE